MGCRSNPSCGSPLDRRLTRTLGEDGSLWSLCLLTCGGRLVGFFLHSFNSNLLGFYYGPDTHPGTEGQTAIRMGE